MLFWILLVLLAFCLLLLLISLAVFLVVTHHVPWASGENPQSDHPAYGEAQAFLAREKEEWTIKTADGLELHAWYVAAAPATHRTVMIANGYQSIRPYLAAFGELFLSLGYNVLLTAYRANSEYRGKSGGRYLGFGWLDRADYKRWVDKILDKDSAASIAMFGISMGASSTMLLSGEPLPAAVKCFIADCGYSNLWKEMVYKARHDYHLPAFPLVHLLSLWSRLLAGYSYQEVDVLPALARNTRPILFIHGEEDEFVPTVMVHENYEATAAPKVLKIIPEATHARSYYKNMPLYRQTIADFLAEYFVS